jgi:hypothetical protein
VRCISISGGRGRGRPRATGGRRDWSPGGQGVTSSSTPPRHARAGCLALGYGDRDREESTAKDMGGLNASRGRGGPAAGPSLTTTQRRRLRPTNPGDGGAGGAGPRVAPARRAPRGAAPGSRSGADRAPPARGPGTAGGGRRAAEGEREGHGRPRVRTRRARAGPRGRRGARRRRRRRRPQWGLDNTGAGHGGKGAAGRARGPGGAAASTLRTGGGATDKLGGGQELRGCMLQAPGPRRGGRRGGRRKGRPRPARGRAGAAATAALPERRVEFCGVLKAFHAGSGPWDGARWQKRRMGRGRVGRGPQQGAAGGGPGGPRPAAREASEGRRRRAWRGVGAALELRRAASPRCRRDWGPRRPWGRRRRRSPTLPCCAPRAAPPRGRRKAARSNALAAVAAGGRLAEALLTRQLQGRVVHDAELGGREGSGGGVWGRQGGWLGAGRSKAGASSVVSAGPGCGAATRGCCTGGAASPTSSRAARSRAASRRARARGCRPQTTASWLRGAAGRGAGPARREAE